MRIWYVIHEINIKTYHKCILCLEESIQITIKIPSSTCMSTLATHTRTGKPGVPKKEIVIDPINPRVSWDAHLIPGRKLSISRSILVRFALRLAGSTAIDVLQGVVFFSYFFSNIFVCTLFEGANKIMIM